MSAHVNKSAAIETALLKQLVTLAEQRPNDLLEASRALQALLEGAEIGRSSLDDKLIYRFEDEKFSERQMREDRRFIVVYGENGETQTLRRHRNGGGWVPLEQSEFDESKPYVAESAYIGPNAEVRDNARVFGNAQVWENAQVYGNARVFGNVQICDNAEVRDNAQVCDNAEVRDNAQVYNNAQVCGNARVFGKARVFAEDRIVMRLARDYVTAAV